MTATLPPSASPPHGAASSPLSFEAALEELSTIVRQLEAGQVPLDQTIALYERATALKVQCEARLRDAELRIERIVTASDGRVTGTAPFDERA